MAALQCLAKVFLFLQASNLRFSNRRLKQMDTIVRNANQINAGLSNFSVHCTWRSFERFDTKYGHNRAGKKTKFGSEMPTWNLPDWIHIEFLVYIWIAAINLIVYWPSTGNHFVFDDLPAIFQNRQVTGSRGRWLSLFITDFWGTPIYLEQSHKSYRPLTVATFKLNFALTGLQPFWFQFTNVWLNVAVCQLNYRFYRKFANLSLSLFASALFSLHPVHVDAVTSVVGRAELLSALLVLISLNMYCDFGLAKRSTVCLLICASIGTLCKEQAIMLIPICIVFDWLFKANERNAKCIHFRWIRLDHSARSIKSQQRCAMLMRAWPSITAKTQTLFVHVNAIKLLVGLCIICLIRWQVMNCSLPKFSRHDNPLPTFAWPYRQLSLLVVWLLNIRQLIYPASLSCDWSASSVQLVSSLNDIRKICPSALFCALFAALLLKHWQHKTLRFMCLISLFTFLPASNALFWVGFVMAERTLYLPSIGFSYTIAHLVMQARQTVFRNAKWVHSLLCLLLLFAFAAKTYERVHQWHDEHTLFSVDLKTHPNNVKLLNNLGKLEESRNNFEIALQLYARAVQVEPADVRGWLNSANLNTELGNYQLAERQYRKAIASFPDLYPPKVTRTSSSPRIVGSVTPMQLRAAINLANLMSNNPLKKNEAIQLYERVIALKPDYGATYFSWIHNLLSHNSTDRGSVQSVLIRLIGNSRHLDCDLLYNVAVLLSNSGDSLMALQVFDQILKLNPVHQEALITSARIIRKNSKFNKLHRVAIDRLEKIVSLKKFDHTIFFELGMLYINFNIEKSINYLQKAIQLKPHFSEALFNLSLLLYKLDRSTEALPFLELLLKNDESHQKAMILLIAINSSLEEEEMIQFQSKSTSSRPTQLPIQ